MGKVIDLAGGLTYEANLEYIKKNINKAPHILDGVKIYFLYKSKSMRCSIRTGTSAKQSVLLSINNSLMQGFDTSTGIGSVTADKTINGRTYSPIVELKTREIVSNPQHTKVKELVI